MNMMKLLSGDWPADSPVVIKKSFTGSIKGIMFQKGLFSYDTIPMSEIKIAELVTAENSMSIGKKLGWGIAGAVLLGPIGAIIGGVAGGNSKTRIVAVSFSDGRKALIKGSAKEVEPLIAAGFKWDEPEE